MSIGKNIKALRKDKKLTQVELANRANISRSYLADIEGDRYNPSIETLTTIANALNVQITDILGTSEDKLMELLSILADQEGFIKEEYRTDVFNAILHSGLNMSYAHPRADFYTKAEEAFNKFFFENVNEDDIDFSFDDLYVDAETTFNRAYETRTIKAAFTHNRVEVQENFLEELQKILAKYNIKTPASNQGFNPYDILHKKIIVDGKEIELSEEQREKLLKLTLAAIDAVT